MTSFLKDMKIYVKMSVLCRQRILGHLLVLDHQAFIVTVLTACTVYFIFSSINSLNLICSFSSLNYFAYYERAFCGYVQLFGLVNTLLANSRLTAEKDLSIQRYAVIPLSPNSGLIGWVPNCDTLHHLIREYRDARKVCIQINHYFSLFSKCPLYSLLAAIRIRVLLVSLDYCHWLRALKYNSATIHDLDGYVPLRPLQTGSCECGTSPNGGLCSRL